jgi:hypothetical protein
MQPMTAAQQAQYKTEYDAAKAKWASLTPQQKSATIAAARNKKLSELSAMELVGQRDDMQSETAAQTAQMKAEADAAKTKWDKLTPAEKQALRKSAWQKKRAELPGWRRSANQVMFVLPFAAETSAGGQSIRLIHIHIAFGDGGASTMTCAVSRRSRNLQRSLLRIALIRFRPALPVVARPPKSQHRVWGGTRHGTSGP